MKRLATIGAVGTIMMLSVAPITVAHADPINNDTVKINGVACPAVAATDDGTTAAQTRCNYPANFTVPTGGRVEIYESDGSVSDIIWDHEDGSPDHFHFISDPTLNFIPGHRGDFNTLLDPIRDANGNDLRVFERAGDIDVSSFFGLAANTVVITSDVADRGPDPAPEPTTLNLLVVGLAGLGYGLRQRKL